MIAWLFISTFTFLVGLFIGMDKSGALDEETKS